MELLLQQVFNGIMLGSTYAIVALGLTLVFGILEVPNFAHGDLYMLGAYVSFSLQTLCGFGFPDSSGHLHDNPGADRHADRKVRLPPLAGQTPHKLLYCRRRPRDDPGDRRDRYLGPPGATNPNPYPGIFELLGITMTYQRLLVIIGAMVLIVSASDFHQENHGRNDHRSSGSEPGRGYARGDPT